jgi:diguanylate cyclase (GGDEF)-like protein
MTDFVKVTYAQTGASQSIDKLGMRAMQARAFGERNSQFLLVKAPPASGKSRALMFIALDKILNQGVKKAIVAVPERSIGSSFRSTPLTEGGFFADWTVDPKWNLTDAGGAQKTKAFADFMGSADRIMVCTHATLRFAYEQLGTQAFDDCLLAIDEFHHASSDENSRLGELVRGLMDRGRVHLVAMTGSFFRGDAAPVLRPEDEARFNRVTYTYYEQLNGYKDLKTLGIGYHFYRGRYVEAINEILDPTLKTILHIPSVRSTESTTDKYNEVDRILDHLGTVLGKDPKTGFYRVQRADGAVIKVADLVDDGPDRETVMTALRDIQGRDDVDIIIALGMAKEGFDWIWCEHALTVGYRGSLTEVIQIIGRATRDAPGKSHAQFTNLIAEPDATEDRVVDAVNNMLKAIACSLLMEQVLAPNFKFKTKADADELDGTRRESSIEYTGEDTVIAIKGFAEPSTARSRQISLQISHRLQQAEWERDAAQQLAARLEALNQSLQAQVAENERLQERLRAQALEDPLTGLHNRRHLFEAGGALLALLRRRAVPLAAVLVDLDHFKQVNDRHGHDAGDRVLRGFAELARSVTRAEDIVCRHGGEEFVLLFPGADAPQAAARLRDLLQSFRALTFVDGSGADFSCSFSAGVAGWRGGEDDLAALLARADAALYAAKQGGRAQVCIDDTPGDR